MKLFGLLGGETHGVMSSPSPAMHRAAFVAAGLDAVYVPFSVAPADLGLAVSGARALGVAGLNVTIPHKQAVMPFLDDLSEAVRCIGAVNVIVRDEAGRLTGHNADWFGFLAALGEIGAAVPGGRACVVGSGGAARAVVYALAAKGCAEICVLARNEAAARALEQVVRGADPGGRTAFGVRTVPPGAGAGDRGGFLSAVVEAFARYDIIVGCTPGHAWDDIAGAGGVAETTGSIAALQPARAEGRGQRPASIVVMDVVYSRTGPTRLMELAVAVGGAGVRAIDGAAMLLGQGAESFRLWTGVEPPVAEMRRALCRVLGRSSLI